METTTRQATAKLQWQVDSLDNLIIMPNARFTFIFSVILTKKIKGEGTFAEKFHEWFQLLCSEMA